MIEFGKKYIKIPLKNLIKMTYFSRSSDRMFCTCSIHTGYGTIHRELLLGSGNDLINFTNLIVQWNFVKTWKLMNLFSEHVLDSVPSKFLLFIIFIDYYSQMLFLSSSIYQAFLFSSNCNQLNLRVISQFSLIFIDFITLVIAAEVHCDKQKKQTCGLFIQKQLPSLCN